MAKLNLSGWEEKNMRLSPRGLIYKIMDFDSKKYVWVTWNDVKKEFEKNNQLDSISYKNFINKIDKYETAVENLNGNFEKVVLKRYMREDNPLMTDAEIMEIKYETPVGFIVSTPILVKKILGSDFNSRTESWGIDEEILLYAKRMDVEDFDLVDEYNGVHFYTTLNKYKVLGETSGWGKVYLPIKHFKVKKYSDKVPFYAKYIRNVNQ